MKFVKVALPLLAMLATLPTAAQASTANSSAASQAHGWFVWPTSWYNHVGQFRDWFI